MFANFARSLAVLALVCVAFVARIDPTLAATCTVNGESYEVTISGAGAISGTAGADHLEGGDGASDQCNGGTGTDTSNATCKTQIAIP